MQHEAVRCACVVPPYIMHAGFLRLLDGGDPAICIHVLTHGAQEAMVRTRFCDSLFLGRVRTTYRTNRPAPFICTSSLAPAPGLAEPAVFAATGKFPDCQRVPAAHSQPALSQLRKRLGPAPWNKTTPRDALACLRQNNCPMCFMSDLTGADETDEETVRGDLYPAGAIATAPPLRILVLTKQPPPRCRGACAGSGGR